MLKQISTGLLLAFVLLLPQGWCEAQPTSLFSVQSSGTVSNLNITLCLNGAIPSSCETLCVNGLSLSISTVIPNHTYSNAGIKINTAGFSLPSSACTRVANGFCLFSVSDTTFKQINLIGSELTILPTALSAYATQGFEYSQTFTATGGSSPYTYAITAGQLPGGLTLDATTGVISGAPSSPSQGLYTFTITATDVNSTMGSQQYFLNVSKPLIIAPSSAGLRATEGTSYSQTISASGGTSPYTYSVTAGSLPFGLSLDATSGVISGTPTTEFIYTFTVTATDANGVQGSMNYVLVVSGTLTLSPASGTTLLAPVGVTYSQTFVASGGTAPYTYAAVGSLPDGLQFSSTGVLSGTPSVAGTYFFVVQATDANVNNGAAYYSLIVSSSPTLSSISPAGGPTSGGQTVTLSGQYLTGTSSVTFGGVSASSFSVISDTEVTAVTPAGTAGNVTVELTTANYPSSPATIVYTYQGDISVDLSTYYNILGFATFGNLQSAGTTCNGFNTVGNVYPSTGFTSPITYNGVAMTVGPIAFNNGVSVNAVNAQGQSISVTEGNYSSLYMLAASSDGTTTPTITVNYANGSIANLTPVVCNWYSLDCNNTVVISASNQLFSCGASEFSQPQPVYLFGFTLGLNSTLLVSNIQLPNLPIAGGDPAFNVLSFTLVP